MSNNKIIGYKGNVLFSKDKDNLEAVKNGYILVENSLVYGVFKELPEVFISDGRHNIDITDFGDNLIIPGFVDIHLHAPQYENMALGLDKELMPWLEAYTFPEEAKFASTEYAKKVYTRFINDLWENGTTRAVVYATIHKESTKLLMDLFIQNKMPAYVGKVNMDANCYSPLKEGTENSLRDTREIIEEYRNKCEYVKPIITPRFAPVCTESLMAGLGQLSKEYKVPVQTHLCENIGEIALVKSLFPMSKSYTDVYKSFSLLGEENTIMAHCVHNTSREISLLKGDNIFVAHCPSSNANLSSGIAPVKRYLNEGLNIGIGTDISGGHTISMKDTIVAAIQASNLYSRYVDASYGSLSYKEAFYLGTKGGGSFFGKVGAFEKGYEFDALIIDDTSLKGLNNRTLEERLQKFLYNGSKENITARYAQGRLLSKPCS